MNLNDGMLEKAKNAKSAEELFKLAKENGIELTNEEAKTYFARLNAKEGELADDELDNVAGGRKCGTIYYHDMPVITPLNSCEYYCTAYGKTDNGYCYTCVNSYSDTLCGSKYRRNN